MPGPTLKTEGCPLSISIAGQALFLTLPPPLFRAALRRYQAFLLPGSPKNTLPIRVLLLPPPESRKDGPLPVQIRWSSSSVQIRREDIHFSWDRKKGVALLCCRGGIFTLDSFFRILLSSLLIERGGILLHAAGLMAGPGQGLALPGVSGTGKSTAARLCDGPFRVLNDELVAVTPSSGKKGWRIHGTPFWGGFQGKGLNRHVRLSAFIFLSKGRAFQSAALDSGEALRRLLKSVMVFDRSPGTVTRVFRIAGGMINAVKTHQAVFARNRGLGIGLKTLFSGSV